MLDIVVVIFGALFLLTMIIIGMMYFLINASEIETLNKIEYNKKRRE